MINMFSQMACICHFVFYVLPRASYGYIQCGFIPSAVWRFSDIIFQFFSYRNLALNRGFPTLLLEAGMFLLRGCLYAPICSYTPIHLYAPSMFVHIPDTPICLYTHMSPMLSCASLCSRGYLHVIWGCGGPTCWTTPLGVDASPCVQHALYAPLYLCIFYGIFACSMGKKLLVWGFWVSACLSGFWCLSVHTLDVHYVHLVFSCSLLCLKFLVSTTMAMMTTPPVTVESLCMSSISSGLWLPL